MYKNNKFLAVIPARGGSKGIPRKNIIEIFGKPLIQYTIEQALLSKYLDKVIVSTDDEEIAKISKKCGAEVPFIRPKELATDYAKTIDTLLHAINYYKKNQMYFDYIVLLQPTQPLRKYFHIDEAIEKIVNQNEKNLISITKVNDHPILIRKKDENDKLFNLIDQNSTLRRQELPEYYKVNGAIYINKIDDDFNSKTSLNDNTLGYIMDPKFDIDIDEPFDIEVLKLKLNLLNENKFYI